MHFIVWTLLFLEALEVKIWESRDNMYTLGSQVGLSFQKIQCTTKAPVCCPGSVEA